MIPTSIMLGALLLIFVLLAAVFYASRYEKVKEQGKALIINQKNDVKVTFTGGFVWPIINSSELLDITRKKISIERIGKKGEDGEETEGLHCKDNIRADLRVDFYIGVNQNEEDVKKVVNSLGAFGAGDLATLKEHFSPKFSEALKTTCKQFEFKMLFENRAKFRTTIIEVIEQEMEGFKIYDVVIDKIEQTALDAHNPNHVLDVEGIAKIVETTSQKNIHTNILRQDEETKLKEKNVSAEQQRLQLEKALEQTRSTQKREVAIIEAQEKALTEEKREEYLLQEANARIKRETEEGVLNAQKDMEIQVAILNNDKKIKIQSEDVIRAEKLQQVETSKQVAHEEINKEIVLESGRKDVADITSKRVEIERQIAKEEEETANLRALEAANRSKKVKLLDAEAEAEAKQTEEITKAKAAKVSATEFAEKRRIEADAELYSSEKEATALTVSAEAKQRDLAASGLAEVEVEKQRAEAIELMGAARAKEVREVGLAEADSKRAVLEAAESSSAESREYEKWQREKDIDEKIRLAEVTANKEVGIESAKAMGNTLSNADIHLFGGDDVQSIKSAVMGSKTLDAKISGSTHLKRALERYEGDEENLIADVLAVLQKSEISTGDLANVGISQFLASNPEVLNNLKGLLTK